MAAKNSAFGESRNSTFGESRNSAFGEAVSSPMAASPIPAWSLSSPKELLASSATNREFYVRGHDVEAAARGFYFHVHDCQATTQPCRSVVGGSTQYCFAGTSMPLQDASASGAAHGGSPVVDATAMKAREVEMAHRHAFGAAASTVPGGVQSIVKGQWSAHEDNLLLNLVEQYGTRKWSKIAKHISGRVGKQCRLRWNNHLRPNIKNNPWTEEEDRILVEAHLKLGNKWSMIAKCIPGRSELMVKNHWNSTKRSLKAKLQTKNEANQGPRPTILAEYIQNMMAAGGRPTPAPRAPTPSVELELTLGGPANPSTMPSNSEAPASFHLGNYPDIASLPMHPHLDLSN